MAAAITLLEAGRSVLVLEAAEQPGGGLRSEELTEPGFRHDVCASIMAFAPVSPFLRRQSLSLLTPPAPLAHPLDSGPAVILERSVEDTAAGLDPADRPAYRRRLGGLVSGAEVAFAELLAGPRLPQLALTGTRFGVTPLLPAVVLARHAYQGERAQALLAGCSAHGGLPLTEPVSAAFGLVLQAAAHAGGWPLARDGSQSVAASLVRRLLQLGGEIRCAERVADVERLPGRAVLLDLTPREVLRLTGSRLRARYRRGLERYRYGPGAFKLDWALRGPVPWRDPACGRAATVHLGGSLVEIAAAEREVAQGRHALRPFVILVQASLFDPGRAPAGRHTAYAYCHVPNGSAVDMSDAIERQVERFAPGFRDLVLARSVMSPAALEQHNPNLVGGDLNGGRQDLRQLFTRPVPRWSPYTTPDPRLYLCGQATPPGGGVHGMCGYNAARAALRRALR
ncbi:MAG: NAD(P)/FAD-dependent oxidoreductase [Candidatus Dormibacteraeota bacterium]|nr:NAD(P)/FAD-dependent oxidoreductase [Candidatus Dormibacteraeota bacterium]